jgi:uncharacterized protein YjbI with pentapeptide repeats
MGMFVKKLSGMTKRLRVPPMTIQTVFPPAPLASALLLAASLFSAQPTMASDCGSTPAPGLDWSECAKKSLMLTSSELQGANLFGTDFSLTDLSGSNLTAANLEKANLVRAWLAGARAEKANFARVEAYRSSFVNIIANGASFASAELQRADFSGAQLTGANFEKAELGRAHFKGAVLTGTRFSLANLSRAELAGATFEGPLAFDQAFLYLTRIEGLDLSAAKGLEQAQIDLACGDDKTKLPAGVTAPSSWPCASD